MTHRLIPVVSPPGFSRAALYLVSAYVLSTFILFLAWPIAWPIYYAADWARLIGYVAACFAAIAFAAHRGSSGPTPVVAPLPRLTLLLAAGGLAALLLLYPTSYTYAGRTPWQVLDALADQGGAYRRLQQQLFATDGQRTTIALARALLAPLTYPVVPLAILHWRRIGWIGRAAMVAAAGASVVFSIMRGTDKEIADLLVVSAAAIMVALGRQHARGLGLAKLAQKALLPALALLVLAFVAQSLFTARKDARLGGYASRTEVCANNSRICSELDNPAISWLPLRQRFGLSIFILSTCSGYYGLDLGLEKPFDSSLGAGHSPAATSVYETVTGDPELHHRTYTWRNAEDGWPEEFYWSTLMTWLANDVGYLGAIPLLALLGWGWGLWWREAAAGMSDPAAVLFSLATTAIFYLPANNQVLASYDGYTELAVWIAIWAWHRRHQTLSLRVPAAAP